jgi:hypothetical protein
VTKQVPIGVELPNSRKEEAMLAVDVTETPVPVLSIVKGG